MDNPTSIALSRLDGQLRAIDLVAGNLANAGTPGFRAERMVFADWLLPQSAGASRGERSIAFAQDRATYRDQRAGTITHTGNPLDLAITGEGWFTVQTSQGPRLTRAGRFTLQPDGTIADEGGNALLDTAGQPLQISPADTDLSVAGDGTLSSQNGQLGRIGIVLPQDANKMVAQGARLFRADTPTRPVASPKIVQGAVEESNVQPMDELVRMMATEREFQFVTQFVEAENTRQQNAIDKLTQVSGS